MIARFAWLVMSLLLCAVVTDIRHANAQTDRLPIRVAWQPSFAARLFVARDLGLFEKAGLAPQLVKFVAGPPMLAALQAGDVDVAFMSVNPFLAGLAQGIKLRAFVIESDELKANGLIVRPDSRIEKVADLEGKRVGVTRGSASYYGLKKAIAGAGLTEADVEIRDMPLPTWIPAFTSADVPALWVWSPWLFKIEDLGGKTVATLDSVGITLMQNVYVGRAEWLEKNAEAARRFVHAFDLATEALRKDPAPAKRAVAEALAISPEQTDRLFAAQTMPALEQMVDPSWQNSLVGDAGLQKGLKEQATFMHEERFFSRMPEVAGATDPGPVTSYLKTRK